MQAPQAPASSPVPRPDVRGIPVYIAGRSVSHGGRPPIKLASNESALGASPAAIAAYRAAADTLSRYPDNTTVALRAAIAQAHGIESERIVCGDGSDELLHLLALGYAGEGDEVLHSRHGFVVYAMAARAVGARPIAVAERTYTVDVDAVLAASTSRTRIVFLANPNSTGTVLPSAAVARLRVGLPGNVLLVLDAAYAEFVDEDSYDSGIELVRARDDVVMVRTFSKAYGLAGLRLGWCYAPGAVADVLNRLRGPFNVATPAQAAGVAAVRDAAFLSSVRAHNARWRPWLAAELAALGLAPAPSAANFLLVRFPGGANQAEAALAHLAEDGILVREMGAYALDDCLRITIGAERELAALVASLRVFLGHAA